MATDLEKVLEAMKSAAKPVKPGEIAAATGLEGDVVSKAFNELKKQGKIHSPKKCFYEPTP